MPGNYPKESKQHLEHGDSLKSRKNTLITNHRAGHNIHAELSGPHKFESGYSFSSSVTSLLN
jgi:hypothetical protein